MVNEKSCCPNGSWGKLPAPEDNSFQPKGEEVKLRDGELSVYHVSGDSPIDGKVIVVFTDVFGFTSRNKCICDEIATNLNCTVIMPDILRGETFSKGMNFFTWIAKYTFDPLILGDMDACVDFLESKDLFSSSSPSASISCIGFCWGVWVVAKLLNLTSTSSDENSENKWKGTIKCGIGLHPSTHVEKSVFKRNEDQMLLDIMLPFLLLTAGNDNLNLKQGSEIVSHLESKGGKSIDFPDMVHGWVSRGDLTIENVSRDVYDALAKTTDFLRENY